MYLPPKKSVLLLLAARLPEKPQWVAKMRARYTAQLKNRMVGIANQCIKGKVNKKQN